MFPKSLVSCYALAMVLEAIATRSYRTQKLNERRWRRARRRQALPIPNIYPDAMHAGSSWDFSKIGFWTLVSASLAGAIIFPVFYTQLWRIGLGGFMGSIAAIAGIIAPVVGAAFITQSESKWRKYSAESKQFMTVRHAQRQGTGLALAKSIRRFIEKRHRQKKILFYWPKIVDQMVEADLLEETQVAGWKKRNEELRQRWIKQEWPDYKDQPSAAARITDAQAQLVRRVIGDLQR